MTIYLYVGPRKETAPVSMLLRNVRRYKIQCSACLKLLQLLIGQLLESIIIIVVWKSLPASDFTPLVPLLRLVV